jgi:hypothetical protein
VNTSTPWYARPSTYGAFLAIAAPIASLLFKVNVTDADITQIANQAAAVGAAVGGAVVLVHQLYDHYFAKKD